jgi:hypothetical protein
VKKYFAKVFGTTILINLILLLLVIPIAALLILYTFTVGILTAGWGFILLFILIEIYFGSWIIVMIEDNKGAFDSILTSVSLGKKYFWALFIIALSSFIIGQYIATAFGMLISLLVGWFFSAVIASYFKVVIMLVYKRKKAELV